MNNRAPIDLAEQIAAAFDWWRDAGVDCDFSDAPADWLEKPAAKQMVPAAAETRAADRYAERKAATPDNDVPAIDLATMPDTLAAFADWWQAEPSLADGRKEARIPPRGDVGAALMVIVPEPEREDSDTLLSGPQGRLLRAILQAMNVSADAVYWASALPHHTPFADWPGLKARRLDAVLARHVALVRPSRIVAFGGNVLPLLGHDSAQAPAVSREFNHEGVTIPLLAATGLAALIERPRWKAAFWRGWLDWTCEDQPAG